MEISLGVRYEYFVYSRVICLLVNGKTFICLFVDPVQHHPNPGRVALTLSC